MDWTVAAMTPCLEWVAPPPGVLQYSDKELCAVCGAGPFEHLARMLTSCAERLRYLGVMKHEEVERLSRAGALHAEVGTLYQSQRHAQREAWNEGWNACAESNDPMFRPNPYVDDGLPNVSVTDQHIGPRLNDCCIHCVHTFDLAHGTPCQECASAAKGR